ncbi:hypothetical protein PPS11_40218 [Pseudomonas putida S11]|nr:hypothetical protein PPS11_40218 [Pseudomonas putida S11]
MAGTNNPHYPCRSPGAGLQAFTLCLLNATVDHAHRYCDERRVILDHVDTRLCLMVEQGQCTINQVLLHIPRGCFGHIRKFVGKPGQKNRPDHAGARSA